MKIKSLALTAIICGVTVLGLNVSASANPVGDRMHCEEHQDFNYRNDKFDRHEQRQHFNDRRNYNQPPRYDERQNRNEQQPRFEERRDYDNQRENDYERDRQQPMPNHDR